MQSGPQRSSKHTERPPEGSRAEGLTGPRHRLSPEEAPELSMICPKPRKGRGQVFSELSGRFGACKMPMYNGRL